MRILCTNDDGINAPGIAIVERIARALTDDVWVVAPEYDQSGVAHSISLNDPLRLREISERHFAVRGTPTDCVIMGARHVIHAHKPDLVLSGVNRGRNTAEDVTYSGTIAGALEATLLGFPAIALSQAFGPKTRREPHWETAVHFGPDIIRKVLALGIPGDTLINVNFPDCPAEEVAGVVVVRQGRRNQDLLKIDARQDGRGNPYYWIAFERGPETFDPPEAGTDLAALEAKCISVTPLRLDLTNDTFMAKLAGALNS